MFFPYRAQITLHRFPIITVLVSLLCIAIYAAQYWNERAIVESTATYCQRQHDPEFRQVLLKLQGGADIGKCMALMFSLYTAKDEKTLIAQLAKKINKSPQGLTNVDRQHEYEDALHTASRSYRRAIPSNLTWRLWYPPDSWNVLRMLSAAVAHGSWGHLIGNLIFFFAFAATVEALIGSILFFILLVSLALGTHVVYSLVMLGQSNPLPTLGLSGVVMGVIALFTFFLPNVRIRCLLWLFVFIYRFGIPAWLLAAWYIGWDLVAQLVNGHDSGINLIAHLSGAALGFGIGLLFFRDKRHWARELIEE